MDSNAEENLRMINSNAELYKALMQDDARKVINLCQKIPEGALYVMTIHNDTVLHLATYSKQDDLVVRLLDELPNNQLDKMTRQNDTGNTILHAAVATNNAQSIAEQILHKAPGLLGMRNRLGETAIFRAVRYGKTDVFDFLADKISAFDHASRKPFLQRTDKTTILHIAILAQHFDLALKIAKNYEYLVREADVDGMTALQLLSCNPSPFKYKDEDGFFKRLVNYMKLYCSRSRPHTVKGEKKQRYISALKLARFLIRKDTSWTVTYPGIDQSKPMLHKYGGGPRTPLIEKGVGEGLSIHSLGQAVGEEETPLFLATKAGCVAIVKEIVDVYPQAVDHIDGDGKNIMHVAIKYRQLEIFNLVIKMNIPAMSHLIRKLDNRGNSILHTVGIKKADYVPETMQGPAIELQEELLWFERVKSITLHHFLDHRNHMNQTADGLFASTNNELRSKAIEWVKRTSEGCTIVAVLIATVAFAAAYTVPGGSNGRTGFPILLHQPFFVVFTAADVLSLTFALTSVVIFLSIGTSPFRLEDFRHSLPNKLTWGFAFLVLSVAMMMLAFAATIILMIHKGESWTKVILYGLSLLPVGVFVVSYSPLYISLSKTYKYLLPKIKRAAIPWSPFKITNCFNYGKRTHECSNCTCRHVEPWQNI